MSPLDVPGKNGNINPDASVPRSISLAQLSSRAMKLLKRDTKTVNRDYTFRVAVPGDTKCGGSVAGLKDICFMKIANGESGPSVHFLQWRTDVSFLKKILQVLLVELLRFEWLMAGLWKEGTEQHLLRRK